MSIWATVDEHTQSLAESFKLLSRLADIIEKQNDKILYLEKRATLLEIRLREVERIAKVR